VSAPDAAEALQALAREIETCTRCDLHCNTHKAVPGEGPANARVLFVGEGPGQNEDLQGRPFVGQAGRFLADLLAAAGLERKDVFITNVVKHRPTKAEPNGRVANRAPTPDEMAACRPYLDRQVELIEPRWIVTLGAHSLGAFFSGESIMRIHGTTREKDGIHFFHSFHPAAALYKEQLRDTMLDDMRELGKLLAEDRETGQSATAPTASDDQSADSSDEQGHDPEQLSFF
jgi:uracil-DNA glycosylase family 4